MANKKLIGLLGSGTAAALLLVLTPNMEGSYKTGYLDPLGIPTKCTGDTRNVVVGKRYSAAECRASLEAQLVDHAGPVLALTPTLRQQPWALAALVDFAQNAGVGAYEKHDAARYVAAGQWQKACRALMWSDAGKRTYITGRDRRTGQRVYLRGLDTRRQVERLICEHDVGSIEPWKPSDAALAAYRQLLSGVRLDGASGDYVVAE
jgi:lysozyme